MFTTISKSLMVHVAAPMAALLLIFGLTMFWSSPELITTPSGESWWAPWSWSLNEMQALVNQGIVSMHANYTWTGLLLALTGAAGVAAMAVSSLKAPVYVSAPALKGKSRRKSNSNPDAMDPPAGEADSDMHPKSKKRNQTGV